MELLSAKIKEAALIFGYEKCGIIKLSDMDGYGEKLDERIDKVPEAEGFYKSLYRFTNIQNSHPWAKSIVICVRKYSNYRVPEHLHGMVAKYYLFDSRTDEKSEDYQDSLKFEKYMHDVGIRAETERKFGLTALRFAALKAGLGIIRRNNFFYTEAGSWVYLEAWLIDKELETKEIPALRPCSDKCNLCIKACPSASLSKPYTMSPIACVSCITTFAGRDMPNEKYREQLGNWIYGCDACQDVCPMNKNKWEGTKEFPGLDALSSHITLEQIVKMDYEFLENVMQPKFWYIPKADVWKWKVNAINAMLNNYKDEYIDTIDAARKDSHEKVREMAEWAINQIKIAYS